MNNIEKEVLKYYYDKIGEISPRAIEYLDFVNTVIIYMFEIYNSFDMKNKNIHEESYMSKKDRTNMCVDILRSLNIEYSYIFKKCLNNNLFVSSRRDYSYAKEDKIGVVRTKNFEEVLAMLHEFGHYLHLINCSYEKDSEFWHSTEMIAMTFEFYTLFHMAREEKLTSDVNKSFLLSMELMYSIAYNIISEALALNIIDKCGDIRLKDIKDFKNTYGLNDAYIKTLNQINIGNIITCPKYRYIDDYTYLYGLPMALYMGNRMASSETYKERFIENFSNIHKLGTDKFLKNMSAYQIVDDPECLEWVMAHAYSYTMHIVNEDEFKPKMIKFKR